MEILLNSALYIKTHAFLLACFHATSSGPLHIFCLQSCKVVKKYFGLLDAKCFGCKNKCCRCRYGFLFRIRYAQLGIEADSQATISFNYYYSTHSILCTINVVNRSLDRTHLSNKSNFRTWRNALCMGQRKCKKSKHDHTGTRKIMIDV